MQGSVGRLAVCWVAIGLAACGGEPEVEREAPIAEKATPAVVEKVVVESNAKDASPADRYKMRAERLVQAIDGDVEASRILKMADGLTKTGLSMLPAMVEAHPGCKDYLGAIAQAGPTLKDLPLEEIEKGYHEDGKLPEMPSAECYHGKDLVVHPATVAALAKVGFATAEDRAHAKAEIVEVLSHLGALDAPAE